MTGLPLLQKYNLPATFYLTSGFLGKPEYMSADQALDLKNRGNEIASHTVTHPHLTTLAASELQYELEKSKEELASLCQNSITNFASPFGEYDAGVLEGINKYYFSHRTVNDGFNAKDQFNVHEVKVQNIEPTTTTDEVKSWVNQAKHDKTWLVLVYHQIDKGGAPYSVSPENFDGQLIAVRKSGIHTTTIYQALAELIPQLSKDIQ